MPGYNALATAAAVVAATACWLALCRLAARGPALGRQEARGLCEEGRAGGCSAAPGLRQGEAPAQCAARPTEKGRAQQGRANNPGPPRPADFTLYTDFTAEALAML
jgi:hypothetical protein